MGKATKENMKLQKGDVKSKKKKKAESKKERYTKRCQISRVNRNNP